MSIDRWLDKRPARVFKADLCRVGRIWVGLCLTALCLAGCHPDRGPGAVDSNDQVRRLTSYSLLEHLDQAELRSKGAPIEPRVVKVGGVERPAIFAHAPATIRFQGLLIPPEARLVFGVGLLDGPRRKTADGVEFSVRVQESGGEEVEVWSLISNPHLEPGPRRWTDVEVNLEDFSGRTVDLVLKTDPLKNKNVDFSSWSLPILRSAGTLTDLEQVPIKKWKVLRDLKVSKRVRKFTIEPAAGTTLELAGQVNRTGPNSRILGGAVEFTASIDGESVFTQTLRTPMRRESFVASIPLQDYVDRPVELDLAIRFRGGGKKKKRAPASKWLRSTISESQELPRRHASAGPNLLMVVVDTLRADHMSLYGYGRPTTPNLERLAAEALVFDRAISQSSWTMPATASLLTGLYPTEHGVTDGQSLDHGFTTLAEKLQDHGLTTLGVSANPVVGKGEGFHQGFESFLHLPWARASSVNDLFKAFVEENQGLQWFAYLHYIDPHDPYDAPKPTKGVFSKGLKSSFSKQPAFNRLVDTINFGRGKVKFSDADFDYFRAAYDEEILYWDSEFGKLMELMQQSGVLDNTIVILTSDHGEEFLEHGKMKHGPHLYDESVRVPLIFLAPGRIGAGRYEQPIETRRIFQAVSRLLPSDDDPEELGVDDLFGLERGRQTPVFSHTKHALLPNQRGRKALASVQGNEWKYISFVEHEHFELYNLMQDPAETIDSSERMPEVQTRYQGLLERWLATRRSQVAGDSESDPETMEKLRALGYIE